MRGLAHWCIAHCRRVVAAWVAVAVLTTVLAGAVGRSYVTAYGLPGTDSQRAQNLLKQDFKTQSGDVDAVVFHVSSGTIDSPAVRAAITPMLARVRRSRTSPRPSVRTARGEWARCRRIG
jgi:putative drug exporter of the RND superfamily